MTRRHDDRRPTGAGCCASRRATPTVPIERKPEWIKTRAQDGPGVHRAARPGQARGPAHGVPGGRLPQHLRVLGGPRGDLPHRRRPVHPALRLLPDRHRQARPRSTATSRAASPRACRRWACATPRSPASRATTWPTGAPGSTPRRCAQIHAAQPGHRRRAARRRTSTANPELLAEVFGRRAGGVRAQHRDGAADLQARSGPAFRYERSLDVIRAARADGLVTKSNLILGMGEDARGDQPGAAGPARRRLRADHDHAVPAPVRRGTTRSTRWVKPEEFVELREEAEEIGFAGVHVRAAGALVLPRRPAVPAGDRRPRLSISHAARASRCGTRSSDDQMCWYRIFCARGRGGVLHAVPGVDRDVVRDPAAEVEDQVAAPAPWSRVIRCMYGA